MGKRLLASFLAAAMMLTMAPFAFAIENTEDTINADQIPATEEAVAGENQIETKDTSTLQSAIDAANGSYTLTEDATADITISKDLVLDLGGHTLTNTNAGKATITVASGAAVTVRNGSVQGGTSYYNIEVKAGGTLTLEKVIATAGNTGSSMIDNYGTLTITSGTYTGGLNVVKSDPETKLTITGGTFNLESAVASSYTGVVMNYGDAVITGGTFNQNATTPYKASPTVVITAKEKEEEPRPTTKITGGTFVNKHTSSTAKIFHNMSKAYQSDFDVSGGTFNKKVTAAYCPNYVLEKDSTGMYSIGAKAVAVQVKAGSDYVYENYANIAQAVKKASKNYTVKLLQNVTEDINIPANKVVNLDLNGHTLTNASGDTITVAAKGTLTIQGEGTVDNVTHAKAAIVNNGTVTLNGGTYTRSKEAGKDGNTSGGNSYYTILNDKGGNMTINSGVTVTNAGHFSSMIRNGGDGNSTAKSVLTINGGTFSGGINTIKNDDYGVLTINDGNFSNTSQFVVMNWNDATINGGTFSVNKSAEAVLQTAAWTPSGERSVGKMTINGGTFKGTGEQAMIEPTFVYEGTTYHGTASVSGGVFTADVKDYCAPGYKPELTNGVYVVKAGTNDAINAIDEAIKDGATEDKIKAAVDAVASTPNATLANSSTTMDKLAKLEEVYTGANTDITVKVENGTGAEKPATELQAAKNAALSASAGETITINVDKADAATQTAVANAIGGGAQVEALDITMKKGDGTAITVPDAPVVLTFKLPAGKANATIYRIENDTATEIPTSLNVASDGSRTISGTFEHFSTYGIKYQAATANDNKYEFTLIPDKTEVSAGDTLTYTVKLKYISGDGAPVGSFRFTPTIENNELLELKNAAPAKGTDVKWTDVSGQHEFTLTSLNKPVSVTKDNPYTVGTLVYKVKGYGTTTKVVVNSDPNDQVSNQDLQDAVTPTVGTSTTVTYHVTRVTFHEDDSKTDIVRYVPYKGSDLYESLGQMAKNRENNKASAPTLVDNTNNTEYRLKDTDWHLNSKTGTVYDANTQYITDTTYYANTVELVSITLPNNGSITIADNLLHKRPTDPYVDKKTDLPFTVGTPATSGMKYDVVVKVNGQEVADDQITWGTDADGKTTGTVRDAAVTGNVTFETTPTVDLTADDIYIFTSGEGTEHAYVEYSKYSGSDTLVLIKGKAGANYKLSAGQPTIYQTDGYKTLPGGEWTHAVLVPKLIDVSTDDASNKQKMLTELLGMGLTATTEANNQVIDTTTAARWDTNGNGKTNRDLGDVQAANDFKARTDQQLKWTPSDDLLLLADVVTITSDSANKYQESSYDKVRDGQVDDNDVNAFVYLYAKMG